MKFGSYCHIKGPTYNILYKNQEEKKSLEEIAEPKAWTGRVNGSTPIQLERLVY